MNNLRTQYTKEIKEKVRKIYLSGENGTWINKNLHIPKSCIYRWCKDIARTNSESHIGYKHGEETRIKMSLVHKGRKISEPWRHNIALSKTGTLNPQWKGNEAGYHALHAWVKRHLIKPQTCRDCNQVKPLDLANISQEYKRDLSDWEWLCRLCHMTKDGRLVRLHNIWK